MSEIVFDKDAHRQRIADLKRAKDRRDSIALELNGLQNRTTRLTAQLQEAADKFEEKRAELEPELIALEEFIAGDAE